MSNIMSNIIEFHLMERGHCAVFAWAVFVE